MDLASQLNALVIDLRTPAVSDKNRTQKLQKASFYLPQIRNPQNLWLVLNELAMSPGLFSQGEYKDLHVVFFAIDTITYAANRKKQISDPTITFKQWNDELVKIVYQLPPLVGLIVISALCVCNSPVERHLVGFLDSVTGSPHGEFNVLAAACFSRAQWSPLVTDRVVSQLTQQCRSSLLSAILDTIYSYKTVQLLDPNITGEFGGWSRSVAYLLKLASSSELEQYLKKLEFFLRTAVAFEPSVDVIKPVAFGVTIQLEGLMSQVIRSRRIGRIERIQMVQYVFKSLQTLGYVFELIGSQFDSYQFVLTTCLDSLQSSHPIDRMRVIHSLGDSWKHGQIVNSDINAGNLLFFFEVCEQLMPILPVAETEANVLTIAQRFLNPPDPHQPLQNIPKLMAAVFESAHSVMLAYLVTNPGGQYSKSISALGYFENILPLFPKFLSANQFKTAIEAILRSVESDKREFILNHLYISAKTTIPGMLLPENEGSPPTIRSAYISILLHGVVQHCEAPVIKSWLSKISPMVPAPFSPETQQEREYLIQTFKDVVTIPGPYADIGIKWFFNDGWSRM